MKYKKLNLKSAKCPLCGKKANLKSKPIEFRAIGGGGLQSLQYYTDCENCGEKVSADAQTETALKEIKHEHIKAQLPAIIHNISISFPSISYVERSLGLPIRSFNRWKCAGTSSSSFLLAKYLESMPILCVELAKNDFNEDVRDRLILEESKRAFKRLAAKSSMSSAVTSQPVVNGYSVMYTASSVVPELDYSSGGASTSSDLGSEIDIEFENTIELKFGT